MIIHDISLPVSEALVVWPGDPAIHITQPSHLDKGDEATVSRLDIGAHTGTHVDAPCHYIRGGPGIDSLDLNTLVGSALVVEIPSNGNISVEVLEELAIPPETRRVLFRTTNSELWLADKSLFQGFRRYLRGRCAMACGLRSSTRRCRLPFSGSVQPVGAHASLFAECRSHHCGRIEPGRDSSRYVHSGVPPLEIGRDRRLTCSGNSHRRREGLLTAIRFQTSATVFLERVDLKPALHFLMQGINQWWGERHKAA